MTLFERRVDQKANTQNVWLGLLHLNWRKLTKRAFKRKIHKLLFEIEDYYVDAQCLILNLNTSNYYTL